MNLDLSSLRMDRYPPEWWDHAIEGLLAALLALCPLALGVVHAWSEEIVIVLTGAMGLTFLLKLVVFPTTPFRWTWAYVPVMVFLLVAAVQLLPLPNAWVAAVSPHTSTLKTELLGDLPNAGEFLSSMSLSFYPRATKHDLRLVLAVAVVFLVVVNVYREPASIKRLLRAIAIIGGGIAILALVQDVVGNGKIYWVVPTYDKNGAYSGPFINHSHYGQFMNLSLGAVLGLLLVMLEEAFAGRRVTPARVARYLGSPAGKIVKLLLAALVLAAATIFLSLSRGAMISMLIAAAFTALVLSARRSLQGRGWIIMLMALGAFICILYVGFEGVYDRLATLRDPSQASSGRWQIVKDITLAWTKFPLLGVGLGTHEVVYPMFNRSTTPGLAMHAENEYAQAAEETGLLGLLPLVAFGTMVAVSYVRNVKAASVPIHAAAYGLGFGLLAVLIHSLSDFGQHLPANAMLSATCCGLLVTLDRMRPGVSRQVFRPVGGLSARVLRLVAFALMVGIFGWALWGSDRARVAEAHWKKALAAERYLQANEWQGSDQAFEYLFSHAEAAAAAEPDNIQYRHWLAAYKWLSLTPYIDPNTGQLPPATSEWVREIVADLHQARPLCPTFGPTCCVVGEIEKFVLGDPNGAARIRQGYRLAPCDPTACLTAARIDAEAGDVESAFRKIARAVQLDRSRFWQATTFCLDTLARPDLALQLAGDNVEWLSHVANKLSASGGPNQLADAARVKVLERLEEKSREPGASARVLVSLANLYGRCGDVELGIDCYRQALMKEYGQVSVHLELARLLKRAGRTGEALHEAQVCLRLSPDLVPAKRLVEELSILPETAGPPQDMDR
jgi:tetratricopeptide (TPR) repeat protein